jgi:hypothetical protein
MKRIILILTMIAIIPDVSAAIINLYPNANGTLMQFTLRVGTGDRWQLHQDNDNATYTRSLTVQQNESVNLQDLPANAVSINNVTWKATLSAQGAGSGSNTEQAAPIIYGGNWQVGTAKTITRTTFNNYEQVYSTNPSTSSGWTVSEINSLMAGTRNTRIAAGENISMSEVWVVVDYVEDITPPNVQINQPQNSTLSQPIVFNVTTNEDSIFANYTLNNGVTNYTMQNNGNRDFYATNTSIADGSYTVKYFVWDVYNNFNNTEKRTFTVSNTPPPTPQTIRFYFRNSVLRINNNGRIILKN